MVGPGMMGPGGWMDPYKLRDRAHADEIDRRAEQGRRQRDPSYARLQDDIEGLDRRYGPFGFREPSNPALRLLLRSVITGVVTAIVIALPLALLVLLSFLSPR